MRFLAALVFAVLSTGMLRAQAVCPWFTQGSAAAILGGEVSVTVKAENVPIPKAMYSGTMKNPGPGEGSCVFSRQRGAVSLSLEILVQKSVLPGCPAGSEKVAGIGNEAMVCSEPSVERLSSRVRDHFFSVSFVVRGTGDSGVSVEEQKTGVERAAEQVAGNLF